MVQNPHEQTLFQPLEVLQCFFFSLQLYFHSTSPTELYPNLIYFYSRKFVLLIPYHFSFQQKYVSTLKFFKLLICFGHTVLC